MKKIRASSQTTIDAQAESIYSILADYRKGHPKILSDKHFSDYEVEKGGYGEGTRIRFQFHLLGVSRTVVADIFEPIPGRKLIERDTGTDMVTSFTLEPVSQGGPTTVTISSEWHSSGLKAMFERILVPRLLEKIYTDQLNRLKRMC